MPEERLLNVREAARRLGVHENTLRNWAARGIIRVRHLPGPSHYRRFAERDVERLQRSIERRRTNMNYGASGGTGFHTAGGGGGGGGGGGSSAFASGGIVAKRASMALDQISTLDEAMQWCDVIAQSDLVPQALRGRSANILLVWMMGREIGLSLAQATREIYCPSQGQPQMRGRLLLARLRAAGHDYTWQDGDDWCEVTLIRGDTGREYKGKYTLEDAKTAGLVTQTKEGKIVALSQSGKPMPWQSFRQDMLFWRAVARVVNRAAPEVAMGFDVMEAAPPVQQAEVTLTPAASQPGGGMVAVSPAAATVPAPAAPSAEPGPSPETVAELAELDRQHTADGAVSPVAADPAAPASPLQLQNLADTFHRLGWNPRQHKSSVLEACTAFTGRPILRSQDLLSAEAWGMTEEMSRITGPEEALPVLLADKVETWRQRLRETEPDTAAALFG